MRAIDENIAAVRQLATVEFGSEDDLIAKVVLPFFELLGWDSGQFELKYPVEAYRTERRGRKPEADCVFFASQEHDLAQSLLVVEVKRDDQPAPILQARYYSANLFVPFYVTWERHAFQVFQLHAFRPPRELGEFRLGSLTAKEFSGLVATLSSSAIQDYVRSNEVKSLSLNDELRKIEANYIQSLAASLRQFKTLDLARPLDVVDNYVELLISDLNNQPPPPDSYPDRQGEHPEEFQRALYCNRRPLLLRELLHHARTIAVIGDPGSGKTTLLKRTCLEHCDSESSRLPIFVPVRDSVARSESLFESPHAQLQRCGTVPEKAGAIIAHASADGRLLLCLDGLDELDVNVPSEARQALRRLASEVQELIAANGNNLIVVSARRESWPACRPEIPACFREFELLPMARETSKQFVRRWFADADGRDGDSLIRTLAERHWPGFTANPLFLALVCILFEKRGNLPQHASSIISRCIDVLLEEWDATRRVSRRGLVPGFNPECKRRVLAEVALFFHKLRRASFARGEVLDALKNALPMVGISPRLAGDAFDEITSQHGLIRSWGLDDFWAFPHLCIQELLAAEALRDQPGGHEWLLEMKSDPFCERTLELYSSMGDSSPLVTGLLSQPDNILFSGLLLAANCVSAGRKLTTPGVRDSITESLSRLAVGPVLYVRDKALRGLASLCTEESRRVLRTMMRDPSRRLECDHPAVRHLVDVEGVDCAEELIAACLDPSLEYKYLFEAIRCLPIHDAIRCLEIVITYEGYPRSDADMGDDPCRHRKRDALTLLGAVGESQALPLLIAHAWRQSLSEFVRERAVTTIAAIPGEAARDQLRDFVRDVSFPEYCRMSAASALGPDESWSRRYLSMIAGDSGADSFSRRDAASALRRFVPRADEIEDLTRLLMDTRPTVFWGGPSIAAEALARSRIPDGRAAVILARETWRRVGHENAKLVVEHIERALQITEPGADIGRLAFGSCPRDFRERSTIWESFGEVIFEYAAANPSDVRRGIIAELRNCPDTPYADYRLRGVLSLMTRMSIDSEVIDELVAAAQRCPCCAPLWEAAELILRRRDLDSGMRGRFFATT